ncbi:3-hydroxyacyl-CoA dehyrogenase, putative [Paecilomyces variotii No. 5]|uniref:3-hydroxyacyl-CoA dehyrogenase, putative n=1 Tax=Byssochlamys spectabilis (strain No. 5 / NBRC 109023) TaxID=1356009 RepID=V5FW15_BYSSN|nr:3-hydroxyacyl-CoA dehyrogenase, putative [Paecilomyces variotii No. 5]
MSEPAGSSTETRNDAHNAEEKDGILRIAIIGAGTIGLSFTGLHLSHPANRDGGRRVEIRIYDPRPELSAYVERMLPAYLSTSSAADTLQTSSSSSDSKDTDRIALPPPISNHTLILSPTLADAVSTAHIIQEQGPESISTKQSLWSEIESLALPNALFWSSTSGIPASVQSQAMRLPKRLLVVHPYNPPHIMPLLELVPAPGTDLEGSDSDVQRTLEYWRRLGRDPVVLKEEVSGFVANRLAFALLREGVELVNRGVATPEEIDRVVEQSMGPRWAVRGPFWSYHAGGGEGGLKGILGNIGDTIQRCWDDAGKPDLKSKGRESEWVGTLCEAVERSYGKLGKEDLKDRDDKTRRVLDVTREGRTP